MVVYCMVVDQMNLEGSLSGRGGGWRRGDGRREEEGQKYWRRGTNKNRGQETRAGKNGGRSDQRGIVMERSEEGREGGQRGRGRGKGRGQTRNTAKHIDVPFTPPPPPPPIDEMSVLPGFIRDPSTGRFFRIASDSSGIVGFRASDIRAEERKKKEDEKQQQEENTQREIQKCVDATCCDHRLICRPHSIHEMLNSLSLGVPRSTSSMRERYAEMQLDKLRDVPDQVLEVPSNMNVVGCQFLDVSADGKRITGCWAQGDYGVRMTSSAFVLHPTMNEKGVLDLGPAPNTEIILGSSVLVDMAMAPADRDVTCLLFATATSRMNRQGRVDTFCQVATRPISARPSSFDVSSSPIYNISLRMEDQLYSCAWSEASTSIAIGKGNGAEIVEVVSEQRRRLNTRDKRVISQAFDKDGSLVQGVVKNDAVLNDLRSGAKPRYLPGSRNTCWIRPLKRRPYQVVLSTLDGKLRLYDTRKPCASLLSFAGHRNSHSRLPSFVDDDEDFVFAVGSDARTRIWSLSSGRLLSTLTSPSQPCPTDFPRPIYSSSWGGMTGHEAVVIAVGPHLNVYNLRLADIQ